MKLRSRWLSLLWLVGGIASSTAAEVSLRDAMKFKLHYAQGVLEGITTENFPLVATNAQKLATLARSADWQTRATPDYERLTADFLRQTDALTLAAKKQSADAATVAYFQLTVSCVNCHRHLRGVEPVRFSVPRPLEPAVAVARNPAGQFPMGFAQPTGGSLPTVP